MKTLTIKTFSLSFAIHLASIGYYQYFKAVNTIASVINMGRVNFCFGSWHAILIGFWQRIQSILYLCSDFTINSGTTSTSIKSHDNFMTGTCGVGEALSWTNWSFGKSSCCWFFIWPLWYSMIFAYILALLVSQTNTVINHGQWKSCNRVSTGEGNKASSRSSGLCLVALGCLVVDSILDLTWLSCSAGGG